MEIIVTFNKQAKLLRRPYLIILIEIIILEKMKEKIDVAKLIKDKINIVDIISKDQKVIKAGSNYKALCPFHNEKTPSFTINIHKTKLCLLWLWKSGDVFSYLMEKYKISFRDALEKLAIETNTNLKEYIFSNNNQTERKNSNQYNFVMNEIASYYNNRLKNHLINNNISFLDKKNITLEKIKKYKLGLSSNSNELETFLNSKVY